MSELAPTQAELLVTKFLVPRSANTLITRPRLTSLLRESLRRKLTLISAPAGFGKTTLVAAWLHDLGLQIADFGLEDTRASTIQNPHVAWVSLDDEDNNPLRFWTYVFTALDACQPGIGTQPLASLRAQPAPPLEYVLTALINALSTTTAPILLILDDYNVITEPAIHTALTFLLEHLPPPFHLMLLTRADPALPLARLRAAQQLVEVRTDQLRCTVDEATAFLTEVMDVQLAHDALQEVAAHTEGWLVGLQLFGLGLQGRTDAGDLIQELSGSHHYILDYLTEEVLRQQPPAVQTFLLHTSILGRLTAALCDAVVGQAGSQAMLEYLERANLFVAPLDMQRRWYRYHPLFAEALSYRLEQVDPDVVPALHQRASQWYAAQGNLHVALQHAMLAQDWPRAANLIEAAIQTLLWRTVELPTIWRWLQRLPEEIVRSRPRLCLFYARGFQFAGQIRAAEPWLRAVEIALTTAPSAASDANANAVSAGEIDRQRLLGEVAARRALVAGYLGEGQTALTLSQQALAHLAESDHVERALVAFAQALAALSAGQAVAATQHLVEASTRSRQAGNLRAVINLMSLAAFFLHSRGQLHAAWQMLQEAGQLELQSRALPFGITALEDTCRADLLREWNRLDEALDAARQRLQQAKQSGYHELLLDIGQVILMRVHLARGELDAASAALQEVEQSPLYLDVPYHRAWLAVVDQVRLWLALGKTEEAARWAQELTQGVRPLSPFAREREDVAHARILLAQRQPDAALALLVPLLAGAQASERWDHVIELLLLQALAHQMRNRESEALVLLAEAVRLAEPEGYIRRFVDEGAPMAALLTQLRLQEQQKGPTPYLDTLLAAFPDFRLTIDDCGLQEPSHATRNTQHASPINLVDPLTPRELEVLQLLARGASNQEIAQEFVLALDTVKHHVSNILAKLGVNNRTQAVAHAHTLGLLDASH